MVNTLAVELIEALARKAFREVLIERYREFGSIQAVADSFNVTRQALWLWMKIDGVTTRDLKREIARRYRA